MELHWQRSHRDLAFWVALALIWTSAAALVAAEVQGGVGSLGFGDLSGATSLHTVDTRGPIDEAEEAVLDATDSDLAFLERRMRTHVCMELVKKRAVEAEREVRTVVQQLSDRLSEDDAKNWIYHSLLVNCYHLIRQKEVERYGSEDMSRQRMQEILTRPVDRPKLRLSNKQLDVLNGLLRESGAVGKEPELLGSRLSMLDDDVQLGIGMAAACVCSLPLLYIAVQLLCPCGTNAGLGGRLSRAVHGIKDARGRRKFQRALQRAERGKGSSQDIAGDAADRGGKESPANKEVVRRMSGRQGS